MLKLTEQISEKPLDLWVDTGSFGFPVAGDRDHCRLQWAWWCRCHVWGEFRVGAVFGVGIQPQVAMPQAQSRRGEVSGLPRFLIPVPAIEFGIQE